MSSDSEPIWLREPAFKADLVAFSYAHGISGRGWPDAVILDNGGDVRTSFYEQKSYVPQRTCLMDSVGHDAEHGRGERRFRCRACGHAFLYRDEDGARAAPAFCPASGSQLLRAPTGSSRPPYAPWHRAAWPGPTRWPASRAPFSVPRR